MTRRHCKLPCAQMELRPCCFVPNLLWAIFLSRLIPVPSCRLIRPLGVHPPCSFSLKLTSRRSCRSCFQNRFGICSPSPPPTIGEVLLLTAYLLQVDPWLPLDPLLSAIRLPFTCFSDHVLPLPSGSFHPPCPSVLQPTCQRMGSRAHQHSLLLSRSDPHPPSILLAHLHNLFKALGVPLSGGPRSPLCFVVVQALSRVWLFVTSRTAAHQASLTFIISRSLLKLMSIKSVMPSNHLILCRPLLLLPSIFPSIRVFYNEAALCTLCTNNHL